MVICKPSIKCTVLLMRLLASELEPGLQWDLGLDPPLLVQAAILFFSFFPFALSPTSFSLYPH